jgi:putative flippase GtrA
MASMQQGSLVRRLGAGAGRSDNWWQLVRFCAVGATCYVINVGTFVVALEALDLHYLVAAGIAYVVAITSGFFGHRIITFRARDEKVPRQALRFVSVYLPATLLGTALLHAGVSAGIDEVVSQALSAGIAAPLSFMANKMWSFGPGLRGSEASGLPARR